MIEPLNHHLLVALKSAYKHIDPTEEKFGTSKTRGVVLAISKDIEEKCKDKGIKLGDYVYFGKYEDTAPYTLDDGTACILIKLKEVGGRSDG